MPNLTFSLEGDSDVAIAFCTLSNQCNCSVCNKWIKCETHKIGDLDWTYGYIRLKPGATDSYRICNRHRMVACVKYFSSLKSMTIDDFNLIITSGLGNTHIAVISEDASDFGIVEIKNDAMKTAVSEDEDSDARPVPMANVVLYTAYELLSLLNNVFGS
ncbi:hypothetical protein BCR33DRAFT_855113 [Rhizoclosmatium globosum]|uniref:Uncharacterized protein n=1 Tax=Rhizoclosmatium globosum TaxID=329046 RepID=A0A1Y2BR97_9FUNG|nr:hypothetical protein BCR33DRAFT_855113 [Rhizoclosmatium globosum]|eukprot:ORY36665.1 hypothetical protein BCR33DRAFT_855113 [Rhizoclosmatium globosum]